MSHPTIMKTLLLLFLLLAPLPLLAAPSDHLAPVPTPSVEEKDIIALLQIDETSISSTGEISLGIYNPTKYLITPTFIRVKIPSRKVDRIYPVDKVEIPPFHKAFINARANLYNISPSDLLVEIVKISYTAVPKS